MPSITTRLRRTFGFGILSCGLLLGTVGCDEEDPPTEDAAVDAGVDASDPTDAAMLDSSPLDAPVEEDAATIDAPPDSGIDPICGDLGIACEDDDDCPVSERCLPQADGRYDDELNMTMGLPDGVPLDFSFFVGGYCTPRPGGGGCEFHGCDGECAVCGELNFCLRGCMPSLVDGGGCREGYTCSLESRGCTGGCFDDTGCRIRNVETNGIAGIQTFADCFNFPALCGDDPENFDQRAYDPDSTATCNSETGRCEDFGAFAVVPGEPCQQDYDCGDLQVCRRETDEPDWVGGTCVQYSCDLPGFECRDGSKCYDRLSPSPECLAQCTIAEGAGAPRTWPGNNGGCREGYTCFWDGETTGINNGVCRPGNRMTGTTPMGGACSMDSQCYSPFGLSRCLRGYCTLVDCQPETNLPVGVCGADALCVSPSAGDPFMCLQQCDRLACPADSTCSELRDGTRVCTF